jgi:hypothetical protein
MSEFTKSAELKPVLQVLKPMLFDSGQYVEFLNEYNKVSELSKMPKKFRDLVDLAKQIVK